MLSACFEETLIACNQSQDKRGETSSV